MTTTAPSTSNTYTDAQDIVEDIVNPTLKAMVRGSMAWSIDAAVINAGRNVFYTVRKHVVETHTTIDEFNEFINAVAEMKAGEQYNVQLGFEENAGLIQQIGILHSLSARWHDLAEAAHANAKMPYKPKTLVELMADEKIRTLDEETTAKIDVLATFATRNRPEYQVQVRETLAKQQQSKFAAQHETRKLLAPAVMSIIQMADYDNGNADHNFWELPMDTQHRLLTATKQAAERTMNTLSTWRGISQFDFATSILPDGFKVIDDINALLALPKYAESL